MRVTVRSGSPKVFRVARSGEAGTLSTHPTLIVSSTHPSHRLIVSSSRGPMIRLACSPSAFVACRPAEPPAEAPRCRRGLDRCLAHHTERFVEANGVRLHVLDWGGTGPALILIHGYGDSPHVFDDIAPALTDQFHVVAYARRGHGKSSGAESYSNAALAGDLIAVMDSLGIAKASLAGWSMGGNEITAAAGTLSRPGRAHRLSRRRLRLGDPAIGAGVREPADLARPAGGSARESGGVQGVDDSDLVPRRRSGADRGPPARRRQPAAGRHA